MTEALYGAGFNSSGRFYDTADAMLGMTPTAYRAGGAGEVIRHAVGRCALGCVLVAASGRGMCAILLGNDPGALAADLAARFPRARHEPADAAFARVVAEVVRLVDDPAGAGADHARHGTGRDGACGVRAGAPQRKTPWVAHASLMGGTALLAGFGPWRCWAK